MGVNNSLLKSIQTIVDKEVESASFDKTRQAQVIGNNADGTYTVRLDGVLYNNVSSYPKSVSITEGSVVKIVMPSNQPSQMYIITPKGGGGGGDHLEITQEDYDDLPTDKKQGDTVFFVTESEPEYLIMSDSVPIGAIQSYGGNVAPSGWLICDGRAISRTEYSELFYAIGTTYGSGDGSTTFNIPDLRGRVSIGVGTTQANNENYWGSDITNLTGATTNFTLGESGGETKHTLNTNQMPNHRHSIREEYGNAASSSYPPNGTYNMIAGDNAGTKSWQGAPISYEGGGGAHNNMQPYLVVNYIIKAKQPPTENVIKGLDPQGILIDAFYPVGTEYATTNSIFDPNVTWGGTWTKTTVSDDEIIEQGINGLWTYRKWKSGFAEIFGRFEDASITTGYTTVNHPFTFLVGVFNGVQITPWYGTSSNRNPVTQYYTYGGVDSNYQRIIVYIRNSDGSVPNSGYARAQVYIPCIWKTYTAPSLKYVWYRTA